MIEPSVFWIILVIVFAIAEAASMGLTAIWFAVGSLAAALSALFGIDLIWQILVFIAVSALCVVYTKPFVVDKLKVKKTPTNLDRNIGKKGVVTEDIDNMNGKGQVKINGLVWTAVSENGDGIKEGETVVVKAIKGVKLIVVRDI